jgi:hypothetical protein
MMSPDLVMIMTYLSGYVPEAVDISLLGLSTVPS